MRTEIAYNRHSTTRFLGTHGKTLSCKKSPLSYEAEYRQYLTTYPKIIPYDSCVLSW